MNVVTRLRRTGGRRAVVCSPGRHRWVWRICNVIAGLAHDHLFVQWDQGARALALLRSL
jgi:hypothetical protein